MAGASWPPSWRSVKVFAFSVAFFIVGGVLLAAGMVVQAVGSLNGDFPQILGLLFMIGGLVVASGKYAE